MRVSKVVREYIQERVAEKLMEKYADQKDRADYEVNIRNAVLNAASKAGRDAFAKVVTEKCAKYNFLEASESNFPSCVSAYAVSIPGRILTSSVHHWHDRMEKERDTIVKNIIVQLELGGNKDDLERMLFEI